MSEASKNRAATPNPALKQFNVLVGEWNMEGTHPLVPDTKLHGRSSFEWIDGGAFLEWRAEMDREGFPTSIAIFGSDDSNGEFYFLYFDDRKVSRKFEVSVQDNVISWWRDSPDFSQRYTWTVVDNGNTIIGKGELSRNGKTWEKDLDLTFTRKK